MALPDVAVIVPWSSTCPHRLAAWEWVRARFTTHHPDWPVIEGTTDVPGFSRTQGILDGIAKVPARAYIVSDADVWCDGLTEAVKQVHQHGWAIPHRLLHRLSPESTTRVLAGEHWRGLPLSTDNRQDSRPYRGHETDTLCVFTADVLASVPPDPRFVGWGQEGDAWSAALNTLVGPPWRGTADIVHLWHPAQPRLTRAVGNRESQALWKRYAAARRNPEAMRRLVDDSREVTV